MRGGNGITRRDILRAGCCSAASFAMTSALGRLNLIHALATGQSSGYQALVCIFLFGGNDSNNLIVPNDTPGYQNYANIRANLALPQSSLLPIIAKTGSVPYGLHPNFPGLQALFNSGQLAVVANVGTLSQPVTRSQYQQGSVPLPLNLFSHSDQQGQWQTAEFDGFAPTGWAGRTADVLQPLNAGAQYPPITSVAGGAILCNGAQTEPYALIPGSTPGLSGFSSSASDSARLVAFQQLLTFDSGISLVQDSSAVMSQTIAESQILGAALNGLPALQTAFRARFSSARSAASIPTARSCPPSRLYILNSTQRSPLSTTRRSNWASVSRSLPSRFRISAAPSNPAPTAAPITPGAVTIWSWAARCRAAISTARSPLSLWAVRTTSATTAAGFPQLRWISTAPHWPSGSASAPAICPPSSLTCRISPRPRSASWDRVGDSLMSVAPRSETAGVARHSFPHFAPL